MIKDQPQRKMKASSRRAVESAIERSKISKTKTWRELIRNNREDVQGERPLPASHSDSDTSECEPS
jgi:hypothetical protein